MKDNKILQILPLVFFSVLVTIPMLNLPRDMWDGTIIEYASLIKNFSGLQSYFFESTWFLQYPLSLALIRISDVFGVSYKNINALLVLLFMFILLRETFLFSKCQIKLSKLGACFATFLVATFSAWGDLLSSVMTLHLGSMAIGLLSLRAIHAGGTFKGLAGFLGVVISLSLQSQLVYLPVFSYLYDLSENYKSEKIWIVRPSTKTILIFITSLAVYAVVRNFYPPHGLYENYNNLIFLSFYGILNAGKIGLAFGTFLAPIIFVVFCISFLTTITESKQTNIDKKQLSINPRWLLWLLALFVAGSFPYMAVGKGAVLWRVNDWSSRQAFLLVLPTSIIAAVYLQILYEKASTYLMGRVVLIAGVAILISNIVLLSGAVIYKANRQIFVSQLEAQIKLNEGKIRPGLLEIVGDEIPGPQLRVYESNFLMFSATGKANWWTKLGDKSEDTFAVPCYIKQNPAYQIKYIYNYDPSHSENHTIIKIHTTGFKGVNNLIQNFFGLDPVGKIELISIDYKKNDSLKKLHSCE